MRLSSSGFSQQSPKVESLCSCSGGQAIAVIYFRAGYAPTDYPSESFKLDGISIDLPYAQLKVMFVPELSVMHVEPNLSKQSVLTVVSAYTQGSHNSSKQVYLYDISQNIWTSKHHVNLFGHRFVSRVGNKDTAVFKNTLYWYNKNHQRRNAYEWEIGNLLSKKLKGFGIAGRMMEDFRVQIDNYLFHLSGKLFWFGMKSLVVLYIAPNL
ncbi:hypothetical protein LOK49_LG02G01788 [Camellia lanceoleosa]|uniref:Uncharacterized protein n=1 Tax=Camellia lanceoleosa TaxID=1840588 RepID=A0ACC0IQ33_9ERIC|nr:hypothetical protein LOK49_LG02G01788 [Camellia lanceoleosa]